MSLLVQEILDDYWEVYYRRYQMKRSTRHGIDTKVAARSLNILNLFLLSVHICFLLFFAVNQIMLMGAVNVFSVVFYTLNFFVLKREMIGGYIVSTFAEIIVHMFLATLCMGWDCGFQLFFVGCIAVVFYADYFSVKLGKRKFKGALFSIISSGSYFASLFILRRTGALYEVSENMALWVLVANSLVVFVFVAIFYRMLTNIAIYNEQELERQASHDMLTGLVNRYSLIERLQDIYERGDMDSYWLAILDIDNFKLINDIYGHNCGDYILKGVAELIRDNCGGLTACRWGGEEFVLVGQAQECGVNAEQPECRILEKIRSVVSRKKFEYCGKQIRITVTIGVSRHMAEQSIDEWINIADKKLYQGKQNGKNQVVI